MILPKINDQYFKTERREKVVLKVVSNKNKAQSTHKQSVTADTETKNEQGYYSSRKISLTFTVGGRGYM